MFVAVTRLLELGKVLELRQPRQGSAGGQSSLCAGISKALRILSGSEATLCFPVVTNSLCASPSSSIETNSMSKNPSVQRVTFFAPVQNQTRFKLFLQWITSSAALVECPSGQQFKLFTFIHTTFAKDYRAHVLRCMEEIPPNELNISPTHHVSCPQVIYRAILIFFLLFSFVWGLKRQWTDT